MLAKHVHRLRKKRYKNGTSIFFCTLPDCHYKIECDLSLGKESMCNECGETFLMNEYTIRLTRPHCHNCGKREVKVDGKRHYVSKRQNEVLVDVAAGEVVNLRSRLDNLVNNDEDI
jgi:hypothetical protein